jgi:hypothetical protein
MHLVPHNEKRMPAKPSSAGGFSSAIRTPQVVLMVLAGVAVAILGPYALYQAFPHPKATRQVPDAQAVARGIDLDISELDTLPDSLRNGAMLLLTADTADLPDAIANLAVATGVDVLRPVSEAVEETQPVLSWSAALGEPPYSVSILDERGQVIARAQGIQNTSWTVLMPLRRGGEYTWQVTVAGTTESAAFRVLDDGQSMLWRAMQAAHRDSPLVMGLVAQQLGMLAVAEREYTSLTKAYPDSNTAALLLNNISELRDR